MKHELTTTKDAAFTIYTYGTEDKHGEYFVKMFVVKRLACAALYLHHDENGDFEICEVENVNWNKHGRREMLADLMTQVVREGHYLPALHLLADLAEDMR